MKKLPWGDIALWVVAVFLVYVFARQGPAKFSSSSGWARAFAIWHYPVWFRIVIGVVETTAAALLLTRRTASIGAAIDRRRDARRHGHSSPLWPSRSDDERRYCLSCCHSWCSWAAGGTSPAGSIDQIAHDAKRG
jgi:hypothetical protein